MRIFKRARNVPEQNPMDTYVQSDAVDRAWALWSEGKVPSPYCHLFEYVGGVNGEGHHCFFDNNEETLDELVAALSEFLPAELYAAVLAARDAYRRDRRVTKKCDAADRLFARYEYDVMQVLERIAAGMTEKP